MVKCGRNIPRSWFSSRFNKKLFDVFQGKKLPANLDPNAEEGDVSDEDTGDEEEEEDEEEEDSQANSLLF